MPLFLPPPVNPFSAALLQVSSMGITPFFVENVSELQLFAIKLVTAVSAYTQMHIHRFTYTHSP